MKVSTTNTNFLIFLLILFSGMLLLASCNTNTSSSVDATNEENAKQEAAQDGLGTDATSTEMSTDDAENADINTYVDTIQQGIGTKDKPQTIIDTDRPIIRESTSIQDMPSDNRLRTGTGRAPSPLLRKTPRRSPLAPAPNKKK